MMSFLRRRRMKDEIDAILMAFKQGHLNLGDTRDKILDLIFDKIEEIKK